MSNGEVLKNYSSRIKIEKFVTDPSFSKDIAVDPFEDDKGWFASQERYNDKRMTNLLIFLICLGIFCGLVCLVSPIAICIICIRRRRKQDQVEILSESGK